MNSVNILGTITKDIELKETSTGVKYCRFSIAVRRNFANPDGEYESDFFNIIAWRKTAEFISEYFGKGKRIGISGRLQQSKFTDKDGNERTSVEIVANEVQLIEKKSKETEETPAEEENKVIKDDEQVYADFGDSIEIDDDFDAF
jgi:single-strand DNA-binding protein